MGGPGPDLNKLEGIDWQRLEQKQFTSTCASCGQTFVTPVLDLVHEPCIRRSHFFRPGQIMPFGCNQCDAVFWRTDQLEMHLLLHQQQSGQQYRCNHCGHRAALRNQLFQHLIDQHYSQPCPVHQCPVRLQSRSEWTQHVHQVHHMKWMECGKCGKLLLHDIADYVRHRNQCKNLMHAGSQDQK